MLISPEVDRSIVRIIKKDPIIAAKYLLDYLPLDFLIYACKKSEPIKYFGVVGIFYGRCSAESLITDDVYVKECSDGSWRITYENHVRIVK